jgi:hypothetical protein
MEDTAMARPKGRHDKKVKLGFLAVGLAVAGVVLYYQLRGPMMGWSGDLNGALAQAKAQDKRVLLFVRAFPSTPIQKQLIETTFSTLENRKVIERDLITVELRFSADADWAKRYGVTTAPAVVVISPDGKQFHRQDGNMGQGPFRSEFLKAPMEPVKQP